jgi:hypothetical protein
MHVGHIEVEDDEVRAAQHDGGEPGDAAAGVLHVVLRVEVLAEQLAERLVVVDGEDLFPRAGWWRTQRAIRGMPSDRGVFARLTISETYCGYTLPEGTLTYVKV